MGTGCAPPHSQSVLRLQAVLRAECMGKTFCQAEELAENRAKARYTPPLPYILPFKR